ncbi:MAG: CRTAC1 family protein [Terriglobia bacterium]
MNQGLRWIRLFLMVGVAAGLSYTLSLPAAPSPAPSPIRFEDIAARAGITPALICGTAAKDYILEVSGTGVVWFDYDNDGFLDLYFVNGSTIQNLIHPAKPSELPHNYLFRNNGDGTFTDVTMKAGVPGRGWGNGALAADFNNDGYADLFISNFGPNVLYQNNGDGTFTEVTRAAGVSGGNTWHSGSSFGDYDNDGFLDLYVAGYVDFDIFHPPVPGQLVCAVRGKQVKACGPRGLKGAPDTLYHNNGNGTFTDVTEQAGVKDIKLYYGFSPLIEDLDGDGFPDIVVTNDSTPNYFYHNKKDGTFEEIGVRAGIAYNGEGAEQSNMGLAVGDIDNDGQMDLFITTFADDNYTLFHNDGNGLFSDISYPSGLGEATVPYLGWATFFFDYNNDGWKDLFCLNGHVYPEVEKLFKDVKYLQSPLLFENLGNRKFKDVSEQVGLNTFRIAGRGAALGDFDNDGDFDIAAVNMDYPPLLLRNQGGNALGHWLELKLIGTKSNRDGIGALVKVVAGSLTQTDRVRCGGNYLSGNDLKLLFGLGVKDLADHIEIRWPSGTVDHLHNVKANQFITVQEGAGQIASPFRPLR